jgi:NOL1/NOP2/fmu family ribosome biogenesis protein
VIRSRYQVLDYNLTKWGQPNKITTSQDVEQFKNIDSFFDLILIDAPCSGEGLFRKDPQAVAEWSPENVLKCSARQKRILGHTIDLLKPGGILLYSTCTYNESENQENADWLLREFPLEVAPLELQPDWGIVNRSIGYQCYPHRLKGEGFYLAAFRKTGVPARRSRGKLPTRFRHFQPLSKSKQAPLASFIRQDADLVYLESDKGQVTALPAAIYQDALRISPHLRYSRMGTPIGRFKGKDLIPAPELVFSSLLRSDLPGIEVDRESALSFLRKEMLSIAAVPGWQLIKHQGLPLGWIKGLKNRINNYYPKEWRIRMQGNN